MKDKQTLKWLYRHSKARLISIFLLSVLRCTLAILGVIFALTSRHVIDAAVSVPRNFEGFLLAAAKLVAIILVQVGIRLLGQSIEVHVGARLNNSLRGNIFSKLLGKDYSAVASYHTGDLMTRLNNDVSVVSKGVLTLIPSALALVAGLCYALYSLTVLDRGFAFIFLFGGIILLLVIGAFRKVLKRTHKRIQETEAKVRSFFQETLSSILMIKVFGIENKITDKGDMLQEENYKAQMKRKNITLVSSAGLSVIFSAGSLYALVWSAYRLFLGTISFGTLTAIIQLVNQVQAPFAGLSGVVPQYYSVLASAERIIELDNLPGEEESGEVLDAYKTYESLQRLCFENISFGYGKTIVFEDASLSIGKGDFAVIGGISGIGKSTLLKLLLGVYVPSNGKIYLDLGKERITAGKNSRSLFSYVPQGNLLLSGTIRDAISMVRPDASDDEIMRAAEVACAAEFIRALPDGLDTVLGEKGAGLSEGQIQRLAVSRAILSDAPIILLDEATSALDEETEEKLLKNIKNLKSKTCLIISHKRAAFEICNKHIYIEDKKIRTETV